MMDKKEEGYSVFVLPLGLAKPYCFTIKKKAVLGVLGILSVASFVFLGLIVQYVLALGQLGELRGLLQVTKDQRVEIQSIMLKVDGFKKQMLQLKEMDQKLRIIAGLSPQSGGSGLGGPEAWQSSQVSQSGIMNSVHFNVEDLQRQALRQEESFQELAAAIVQRQSVLASTPSILPTDGLVLSPFGKRISPFTGRLAMHGGIDIGAPYGAAVIASAAATVIYAGFDGSFGKVVKLAHSRGIQTIYAHLSNAAVRVGQKVKRGETIGFVGTTGLSTGPHLHYEVYVNSVPVDPMGYVFHERS